MVDKLGVDLQYVGSKVRQPKRGAYEGLEQDFFVVARDVCPVCLRWRRHNVLTLERRTSVPPELGATADED